MKKLPIGKQNFKEIITNNFLYVDKTKQIHDLLITGNLFFLSRPRRFGKSLMISLFRYLFSGEKELFKDLYIYQQTDYDWKPSPVLYFNFASYGHQVIENLEDRLKSTLKSYADDFKVTFIGIDIAGQFNNLVSQIAKKHGKVVILIDEYDKPIVDFINDYPKADKNRKVLKDFFSPLKDLEAAGHIRFLFITGISKFSKVSIFSDLNNLKDLTISKYGADLVGITQKELEHYFTPYIKIACEKLQLSPPKFLEELRFWYNGYSWDEDMNINVYNPFSLLQFFSENRFKNYWFTTGTPTFLVERIRENRETVKKLVEKEVYEAFFHKFELKHLDIYALLFQTGYLTIKSTYIKRQRLRYVIGYPNNEVKESFINNLIEAYTFKVPSTVNTALLKIEDALFDHELDIFIDQLKILFSDIAHQLLPKNKKNPTKKELEENFKRWEGYFQTVIYLIVSFLGIRIQCEVSTHKGRLDAVVHTDDFIYLMEFKVGTSPQVALNQIADREYNAPYKNEQKKIILVGIVFDKETRNIKDWKEKEWQRA